YKPTGPAPGGFASVVFSEAGPAAELGRSAVLAWVSVTMFCRDAPARIATCGGPGSWRRAASLAVVPRTGAPTGYVPPGQRDVSCRAAIPGRRRSSAPWLPTTTPVQQGPGSDGRMPSSATGRATSPSTWQAGGRTSVAATGRAWRPTGG